MDKSLILVAMVKLRVAGAHHYLDPCGCGLVGLVKVF